MKTLLTEEQTERVNNILAIDVEKTIAFSGKVTRFGNIQEPSTTEASYEIKRLTILINSYMPQVVEDDKTANSIIDDVCAIVYNNGSDDDIVITLQEYYGIHLAKEEDACL